MTLPAVAVALYYNTSSRILTSDGAKEGKNEETTNNTINANIPNRM